MQQLREYINDVVRNVSVLLGKFRGMNGTRDPFVFVTVVATWCNRNAKINSNVSSILVNCQYAFS